MEQGLTKLVQGASQPKPALGLAEIPGIVEVELVHTAQATTSQAASSTGDQEPAGGKLSSNRRSQGEGHGKGKLIGKQPAKKGAKRDAKEEDGDPSYFVGQKDQPTQARWTAVPGTMFNGQPEVSSY